MLRQGLGRGRIDELQLLPRPTRNRCRTGRDGATSGTGCCRSLGVEGAKVRVRAHDHAAAMTSRLRLTVLVGCTNELESMRVCWCSIVGTKQNSMEQGPRGGRFCFMLARCFGFKRELCLGIECPRGIGLPIQFCGEFHVCFRRRTAARPFFHAWPRLFISRVMAVARGKREDSLVFCGLVGIMDPPRASAIAFAERMQVRWS